MVVFPHPDDETMATGGLLLKAKQLGLNTIALILTQGGEGKIHIHPKGKSAKEVRKIELVRACEKLKVDELIVENFPDAYLRDCVDDWSGVVKKHIVNHKPDLVVTYDHSGITGHPDHIVLSIELKKILKTLKQRPSLYWVAMSGERKKQFARGVDKDVLENMVELTHELVVSAIKKVKAARVYKSQNVMPIKRTLFYVRFMKREWYHKVDFDKIYPHKYVPFRL